MQLDLIDEYRLMVFPVVLGNGKRLFGEGIDKKVLKLAETKTFGSGVVVPVTSEGLVYIFVKMLGGNPYIDNPFIFALTDSTKTS